MNHHGLHWLGLFVACGLLLSSAGCGSNKDVDPVVVPKENQKDQAQFKPATRGAPQSSDNLNPEKKN